MPTDTDPLGGDLPMADRFLFEVDGVEIGVFREVTGLQVTVNVVEVAEGGQNAFTHKLPSRMTWPNITFKRGLTQSDALFDWLQKSSGEGFAGNDNKLTRSTGAVTALDASGSRLRAWEFIDVFPVRWKGPDFITGNLDPLEEELEVAHHGFRAKTQAASG
jgi:phage tail-like protein